MNDLIIIGGGPAGVAAGVYAARKRIQTIVITKDFGGQSAVSQEIQNFIGFVSLPGLELAQKLQEHLKAYADNTLIIKEGFGVVGVSQIKDGFSVTTENGDTHKARVVLVCSGSSRRKLNAVGAEEFDNKGISYCASCDAPIFKGKDVVVVGGGNAGFEAAQQLLDYAPSVIMLQRSEKFRADPVIVEKVLANPRMKAIMNAEIIEVKGDKFVTGLIYKDRVSGDTHELSTGGIFVEIGSVPNSDFAKDIVQLNPYGEIIVDSKTQRTSCEGIWAAGDVSDVLYKQNNISMGDAVKALEDVYLWLQKNHKQ